MRLAPPVSSLALCTLFVFLSACSGGLPEAVGGSSTSTTPGVGAPPPLPAFSISVSEGSAPLSVTFTQLDTSGTTDWTWDFGDGAGCSTTLGGSACSPEPFAPSRTYTTGGVYTVTLTARGPGGTRSASVEGAVEVLPTPPTAAFQPSTTSGVLPLSVTFTNQSSGAQHFEWQFGDGERSSEVSPTHTYTQFGSFQARLVAVGPGGSGEALRTITVQAPPPDANFALLVGGATVDVASGPVPLSVQFVQMNTQFTTSRQWQFGDGSSSTAVSPVRTYTNLGLFDVTLSASGPGGMTNLTRPDVVEAFDLLADGGFEAQTNGQPPSGVWTSFAGNLSGTPGHDVLPFSSPATDLTFPTEGSDWVALSSLTSSASTPPSNPDGVTNPPVGAAGIRQNFSFRNGASRLRFEAAFVTGETPGASVFRDWASVHVSDGTTTRNLYYRDTQSSLTAGDSASIPGTQFSSGVTAVDVNLATLFPGSTVGTLFTFSAQVGNVGGAQRDSYLFLDNVRLEVTANPVVANFTGAPLSSNLNQPVAFTDTSTGSPTAWAWTFGDGASSTIQNPMRAYTTTGPKTVRLTASKPGSSDSLTRTNYVNVFGAPNSSFTANPTSGRAPLRVTLDNTSSNVAGVTYSWNFGDGSTSTQTEPGTHVFQNAGTTSITRTIVLSALTPTNLPQITTSQIVITVAPAARFSTNVYPILSGAACVDCHATFGVSGNFDVDVAASTLRGQLVNNTPDCVPWNDTHDPDRYVIAGDLENSYFWRRVGVNTDTDSAAGCVNGVMPQSGPLPFEQRDLLRSWIEAGALDN